MGNEEETKPAKSEKLSPPATPTNQANFHVYPDWAAMQAYYGPRVAMPPYYNSAVASGHAPHPYMWGPPQPMMPPYGAPYAAIYSHGGVYAHPGVPLGAHGQGVPSPPAAVNPSSVETPTKSSGNSEKEKVKRLKGFDGLAMSMGNGSAEGGAEQRHSQSTTDTDGSSDGSDGNTSGANQSRRKRSREETPTTDDGDEKTEKLSKAMVVADPDEVAQKFVGPAPGMSMALELRNSSSLNTKTSPTSLNQACGVLPTETWLQNERELKRERRKQSNRESARRSRLRKQAETEELSRKVDSLTCENVALKSELKQLTENSEKLGLENAKLLDKLKNARLGRREGITMTKIEKRAQPMSTENLLSRVNNSGSVAEENEMYEKNSNSGTKLHQLLDTSPRADAVAAG